MNDSSAALAVTPLPGTKIPGTILTRFVGIVRRRSYGGAMLDAAVAVFRGVPIDAFLRKRLFHYERFAPQDLRPLPRSIEIVDGDVLVTDRRLTDVFVEPADFDLLAERRGLTEHVRNFEQARDQQVTLLSDRVEHAAREVERSAKSLPPVEEKVQALEAELEKEIAAGTALPPPAKGRDPKSQVGWAFRYRGKEVLLCIATGLVLAVEAYQLGLPYLDMTGVDSGDLATSWKLNPQGVVTGFAFAGAATAMLFVLSKMLVDTVWSLWSDPHSAGRFAVKSTLAVAFAALLASTAVGLASFRHHLSTSAQMLSTAVTGAAGAVDPPGVAGPSPFIDPALLQALTFVLLTLGLPLSLACLHHVLHLRAVDRRFRDRASLDAIETAVAAHARHELMLALIQSWRDRRDAARSAIQDAEHALVEAKAGKAKLLADCDAATTVIRDRLRTDVAHEHRAMVAWSQETLAALELDRFAFIACARRRNRHLLSADTARDLPGPRRPLRGEDYMSRAS